MKIFIPCAGIGSRLDYLTKNLNKSLVSIGDRPAISYIIDKFSKEHTFVIALGYKGELLKQFLTIAYSDYKFEFVYIDNYIGTGSGLGATIHACKDLLQEPFIFIPTDSLFEESEEFITSNKNCIFFSDILDEDFQYRKIKLNNNRLDSLSERNDRGLVYTGICNIDCYQEFWQALELSDDFISQGESFIINKICKTIDFQCKKITWNDIGNLKAIDHIRKQYKSKFNILEKENESIWFLNDKVIKYHNDKKFIKNRVERFEVLKGYIPDLISYSENMYCYKFEDGDTLSNKFDIEIMNQLLSFLNNFWKKKEVNVEQFENNCFKFYKDKTLARIKIYLELSKVDCSKINGIEIGNIESLLNKIDWNDLSLGVPTNFHGDLHFENIIKTEDSFLLLDWRQDFEGDISVGDIYYDFAKLLHGMMVSHDIIKKNQFSFKYLDSSSVEFDLHCKYVNIVSQQIFEKFIIDNNYSFKKVKILTALIFLNIAALHHEPYNHMLYYLGKQQLHYALKEI